MALTKIQRAGIVISILWLLGSALNERNNQVKTAEQIFNTSMLLCEQFDISKFNDCMEQSYKDFGVLVKTNWIEIGFASLSPLILGWLLVLIAVWVYRWIKAGPVK